MANITLNKVQAISQILASNPSLTEKDLKVVFIKAGGTIYWPGCNADGKLFLGKTSFRHDGVLADRVTKSEARVKAKAERDAAKALKHAQDLAEKAQKRADAAQAKAIAMQNGEPVPEAESSITVIGAND